jgi:hypothetical protein
MQFTLKQAAVVDTVSFVNSADASSIEGAGALMELLASDGSVTKPFTVANSAPSEQQFAIDASSCTIISRNIGAACLDAADCNNGNCTKGVCSPSANGAACAVGGDCISGMCTGNGCVLGLFSGVGQPLLFYYSFDKYVT